MRLQRPKGVTQYHVVTKLITGRHRSSQSPPQQVPNTHPSRYLSVQILADLEKYKEHSLLLDSGRTVCTTRGHPAVTQLVTSRGCSTDSLWADAVSVAVSSRPGDISWRVLWFFIIHITDCRGGSQPLPSLFIHFLLVCEVRKANHKSVKMSHALDS